MPDFLLAETQRLYEHFKEASKNANDDGGLGGDSAGNTVGGRGGAAGTTTSNGLLVVKESAPNARVLSPFFEDTTKAQDPFEEPQRLALDAILRLAQRLHLPASRPALAPGGAVTTVAISSGGEAASSMAVDESSDALSRWLSLLCHIIHSASTAFARKQAKKHLLHLCGSKQRYLEVRDRGLADLEIHRVRSILTASDAGEGLSVLDSDASAIHGEPLHLPYELQVTLCNSLQRLHETAVAQPRNWVRYCAGSARKGRNAGAAAACALLPAG